MKYLSEYIGEYDVTILINSLLSLIVFPEEIWFKKKLKLEEIHISVNTLQQMQTCITKNIIYGKAGRTDFSYIVLNMRHALCHGKIVFQGEKEPNGTQKITNVIFQNVFEKTHYEINLTVELLKEFISEIAECLIQ